VDAQALRLLQAGGAGDPGQAPAVALRSIGRGSGHGAPPAAAVVPTGGALEIDRGLARERIEARPGGVEQSWLFASRPAGRGDLEVRLEVSGMRVRQHDERGLRFSAPGRDIYYSNATWIDGKGRKTPLVSRYDRGQIVLSVPEAVLESSTYPALLDPTFSAELVFSNPPHIPGGVPVDPVMDCNADQCLIAWIQDSYVVARRASLAAALQDDPVIILGGGRSDESIQVSARGSDYVVTWGSWTHAGGLSTQVVSSTGNIAYAPPKLALQDRQLSPVLLSHGSGVTYAVLFEASDQHHYGFRFVDGEVQAPTAGIDLGKDELTAYNALVAGPNQFAWVHQGTLQRIDASDGHKLDAAPIELSASAHSASAGEASVTFDGENYLVVWQDQGKLWASRVRASDGTLLDPDSGAGPRYLCKTNAAFAPRTSVVNGKLYVSWIDGSHLNIQPFELTPWLNSAVNCAPAQVISAGQYGNGAGFLRGSRGLHSFVNTAGVTTLGFELLANGSSQVTNHGALNYHSPAVSTIWLVSNGRDFALTGFNQETGHTEARLIDGATGGVLHDEPIDLGLSVAGNAAAALASAGSSYLVASTSKARRLHCDGRLGQESALPAGFPPGAIAGDGERYYAVSGPNSSGITGYRLDLEGVVLDAPQPLVSDETAYTLAVSANPLAAADQKAFVVLTQTAEDVLMFRVRSGTGQMLGSQTVSTTDLCCGNYYAVLSSDGTNVKMLWHDNENQIGAWGATINPATGVISDKKSLPITTQDSLWTFDGTHHVEVWNNQTALGRRFDNALSSPDPLDGFELPLKRAERYASNRYGRTLAVYAPYKPEHLGVVPAGYFMDNDLATGDPDSAPASCVSAGEGGAGGDNGGGAGTGGSSISEGGMAGAEAIGGGDGGGLSGGGGENEGGAGSGGPTGAAGEPDTGGSDGGGTAGATSAGSGNAGTPMAGAGTAGTSSRGGNGGTSSNEGGAMSTAGAGPSASPENDSGCGCRVAPSSTTAPWHLLLGALVLLRRRRIPFGTRAPGFTHHVAK
jgi:MYXO-CTERM domain-containing protein